MKGYRLFCKICKVLICLYFFYEVTWGYFGSVPFVWLILAVAMLLGWFVLRPKPALPSDFPLDFIDHPEKFDHSYITIEGRVVRIYDYEYLEGFRRHLVDIFRTFIKSKNYKGRYSHLRFLVKVPKFRSGQYILVEHNLKFGKPNVHLQSALAIKGEYIHSHHKKHFYGKIHITHEPKGYIKNLSDGPDTV